MTRASTVPPLDQVGWWRAPLAGDRRALLVLWPLFALIGIGWAMMVPVGGSPDEPQHIVKAAAVVRGDLLGSATDQPAVRAVDVPRSLALNHRWTCFAFDPSIPASCQGDSVRSADGIARATTSAGLYNPLYYALVGAPSLLTDDAEVAILEMRILSAVVCAFFFALGTVYLRRSVGSPLAIVTSLVVLTPMVAYLMGAVNPNALEVTAGYAAVAAVTAILRSERAPSVPDLVAFVVSALVLVNDRALSPAWLATIAVVAVGSVPWLRTTQLLRNRGVLVALAIVLVGSLFAIGWILATGVLVSLGTFSGAGRLSFAQAFVIMLGRAFDPGIIGYFGWLDTVAPPITLFIWSALIGAVLLGGGLLARGRPLIALLIAVAAYVLVPAVSQGFAVRSSGLIWQGRYGLVAYAIVLAIAAIAIHDGLRRRGLLATRAMDPRTVAVVAAIVVVGVVFAAYLTGKRFAIGLGAPQSAIGFLLHAPWQPPGGLLTWMTVITAATAVLGVIGAMAARQSLVGERREGGAGGTGLDVELKSRQEHLDTEHER